MKGVVLRQFAYILESLITTDYCPKKCQYEHLIIVYISKVFQKPNLYCPKAATVKRFNVASHGCCYKD